MSSQRIVRTPRQLYKFLLKEIQTKLPEGTRDYYRHFVKQQFNSYTDENDPERIEQILTKAVKDAEWIVKKYQTKTNESGTEEKRSL